MLTLSFGDETLIVSMDQPFLMPNGKLKRASHLVPGKDNLVREDGSSVALISNQPTEYSGGVHAIVSFDDIANSLANHPLVANGVVVGDYALQHMAQEEEWYDDADQNAPINMHDIGDP